MTTNSKKKQNDRAYRRRQSANKQLEKLLKIVQKMNNKDVNKLLDPVNNLWWNMTSKLVIDLDPEEDKK